MYKLWILRLEEFEPKEECSAPPKSWISLLTNIFEELPVNINIFTRLPPHIVKIEICALSRQLICLKCIQVLLHLFVKLATFVLLPIKHSFILLLVQLANLASLILLFSGLFSMAPPTFDFITYLCIICPVLLLHHRLWIEMNDHPSFRDNICRLHILLNFMVDENWVASVLNRDALCLRCFIFTLEWCLQVDLNRLIGWSLQIV